ncbi:MAG: serine hydrolase [Desulfobacteraceae bacterium]|nr:serine hydrolase [Desulfobacteraceae bacterium]
MALLPSYITCLINDAIADGLFPGCTLAIGGRFRLDAAFGRFTYAPWAPEVTPAAIYDLASLTKPLATALAAFVLIAAGRLELETALAAVFKDVPADKAHITVRMLLSHSSGLPAHRLFFDRLLEVPFAERKSALLSLILDEPLEETGRLIYSDLGFMLLGLIIEKVAGMRLDEAAGALVFKPLGVNGEFFWGVSDRPSGAPLRFIPSGYCESRRKVVCGQVHDRNAWVVGGVAGHAGLFGTAAGVRDLLVTLLDIYKGRATVSGLTRGMLHEAFRPSLLASYGTWALGFDTPSPEDSSAGRLFSRNSVGHLGFTGTSFWMDIDERVIVVFLSNRTFPFHTPAKQEMMKAFRARLHDAIRMWI